MRGKSLLCLVQNALLIAPSFIVVSVYDPSRIVISILLWATLTTLFTYVLDLPNRIDKELEKFSEEMKYGREGHYDDPRDFDDDPRASS